MFQVFIGYMNIRFCAVFTFVDKVQIYDRTTHSQPYNLYHATAVGHKTFFINLYSLPNFKTGFQGIIL